MRAAIYARVSTFDQEPEKPRHAFVPRKTRACEHLFQLRSGGIDAQARGLHQVQNTLHFQPCASV